MDLQLWEQWRVWQTKYKWVDLTHELSPETPHWVGWPALREETKMTLDEAIFCAHAYTTVGQYGTHVDAPNHMVKGGRSLEQVAVDEMVLPLCIIDKTEAIKDNADYVLTVTDIAEWETIYGKIPEKAFVVFQSGWSKRPAETMDNLDEEGNRHFPGWSLEAVTFLVEERNIGGIGHETSDTEAPVTSGKTNYEVEYYILEQDRIQVELLTNLEECPAAGALIFCTFPKVKGGTGFPARCFALCRKE